ncbi:Hypothetical predicted protein [Paramuricea clavata]|uniref:Uncharacterized protein n=1 Tax=Paramuricea clavata TaxID=317549 RepID=A0A6S7K4E9_PARCT|nr:Hypothetical predicted protein [Paramuricea clavata]
MGINEEEVTQEEFLKDILYLDNEARYEVSLPWKNESIPKSNGYGMCLKRLHQLKSRLDKDKQLLEQYDDIFKDQENSGIVDSEIGPEIVSLLLESLNVDDFARGAYDDDEALHIYRTSHDLMSKGGWHSNSVSSDPLARRIDL